MPAVLFMQIPQLLVLHLCPLLIWLLMVGFFLSICFAIQDGMARLGRLHQIPCSGCDFFTGDYRLKCTVHPCSALSEEAIGCLDYEPKSLPGVPRRAQKKSCFWPKKAEGSPIDPQAE